MTIRDITVHLHGSRMFEELFKQGRSNVINTANESIKTDFEQFFNDSLQEEKQAAGKYKEEYINGIINECWTVIMANKISISVEYTGLAENRLHFLCGANPTGIDYLSADSQTEYCPVLFILAGMN